MKLRSNTHKTSPFGKRIIISVIVILILLGITLFLMGRNYLKTSQRPLDVHSSRIVSVKIPVGSSDRKIGSILQSRHIVRNGLVFNYYVKSHNIRNLQAGYYSLSPSMRLSKIAKTLRTSGLKHPVPPKR